MEARAGRVRGRMLTVGWEPVDMSPTPQLSSCARDAVAELRETRRSRAAGRAARGGEQCRVRPLEARPSIAGASARRTCCPRAARRLTQLARGRRATGHVRRLAQLGHRSRGRWPAGIRRLAARPPRAGVGPPDVLAGPQLGHHRALARWLHSSAQASGRRTCSPLDTGRREQQLPEQRRPAGAARSPSDRSRNTGRAYDAGFSTQSLPTTFIILPAQVHCTTTV